MTYDIYFGNSELLYPRWRDFRAESDRIVFYLREALRPDSLEYDSLYYWKIIAKDNMNHVTEGPTWKFTTEEE